MLNLTIRLGREADADACQALTRKHAAWFPFVMKVSLKEAAERGELLVAEVDGKFAGFVSYRTRKRDGIHTIYELAVDDVYACTSVGRNLLYAVPTPIRLKCPIDNHRANRFYADAGMEVVDLLPAKRPLILWEMRVLCIHVQGYNKQVPRWARESGMAYGTRHDHKPHDYPFMVDINWKDYDWNKYIAKIQKWRPVMAMVADYENPAQKELMLRQVQDLRANGVLRIMVCPKFHGAIADIPADCVLAISVPSEYAGFLPAAEEVGDRRVHLLGGSPNKIKKALKMYVNVRSVDYNTHTRAATFGSCYVGERWYRDTVTQWKLPYEESIVTSAINIRQMINRHA